MINFIYLLAFGVVMLTAVYFLLKAFAEGLFDEIIRYTNQRDTINDEYYKYLIEESKLTVDSHRIDSMGNTIVTLSDGSNFTVKRGRNGLDGNSNGSNGSEVGIKHVTQYYLVSDKDEGVTTSDSGWKTTLSSLSQEKPYLWRCTKTTYADDVVETTHPSIVAKLGSEGEKL